VNSGSVLWCFWLVSDSLKKRNTFHDFALELLGRLVDLAGFCVSRLDKFYTLFLRYNEYLAVRIDHGFMYDLKHVKRIKW